MADRDVRLGRRAGRLARPGRAVSAGIVLASKPAWPCCASASRRAACSSIHLRLGVGGFLGRCNLRPACPWGQFYEHRRQPDVSLRPAIQRYAPHRLASLIWQSNLSCVATAAGRPYQGISGLNQTRSPVSLSRMSARDRSRYLSFDRRPARPARRGRTRFPRRCLLSKPATPLPEREGQRS